MNNVNLRPVTVPTEQAAAYETAENGSGGFEPQSDGKPILGVMNHK